jgi:hypothetical protein
MSRKYNDLYQKPEISESEDSIPTMSSYNRKFKGDSCCEALAREDYG